MKFYEFNETEYYALIGTNSRDKAIEYYKEVVGDTEEDGIEVDEITKERALKELITATEKEDEQEYIKHFNERIKDKGDPEPYLVLIDSNLI